MRREAQTSRFPPTTEANDFSVVNNFVQPQSFDMVLAILQSNAYSSAFVSSTPIRQCSLLNQLSSSSLCRTSSQTSYLRQRWDAGRRSPLCVTHSPKPQTVTPIKKPRELTDYPLGHPTEPARIAPRHWFQGLRDDIARRAPLYGSDWRDGFCFKSIPVTLFLYFACLAPVVAFGGLTASLTGGSIGVIEFLMSSGAAGMVYAVFSGQPLTFIAPTGLTLAFTAALYGFCKMSSLAFLATYAWVGIWTSLILLLAAITNISDVIKYCTRFTDDIFNSLIATNFLYEASRSLITPFLLVGANKTNPFMAFTLALGTFLTSRFLNALRTSRYLVKRIRNFLSDFGPVLSIAAMSAIAATPAISHVGLSRLSIPTNFSLAGGRNLLIPIFAVPVSVRLIAVVPALLLTCLFFLDQNISVRVVNSPQHKLKKGPAYHLDMLILSICTFFCSICGLPWMCAGTVQSLSHVRALAEVRLRKGMEYIESVQENRLTGFCVHAAIFSSLFLLPILQRIPMAVISGLFLYLGVKMMSGNDFLSRIRYLFMDPSLYPEDSPMQQTPPSQVHRFTLLQVACLAMLWVLKLNKRTSMFFPAVIATLMFIRSKIAPRLFPAAVLTSLDGELVEAEAKVHDDVQDPTLSAAN